MTSHAVWQFWGNTFIGWLIRQCRWERWTNWTPVFCINSNDPRNQWITWDFSKGLVLIKIGPTFSVKMVSWDQPSPVKWYLISHITSNPLGQISFTLNWYYYRSSVFIAVSSATPQTLFWHCINVQILLIWLESMIGGDYHSDGPIAQNLCHCLIN